MTDQPLAMQALGDVQHQQEYLRPCREHNVDILDELVEVLERPDLIVAVSRLQQRSG
ncbi:hypothetical protein [Bradyrhizobium sp. USDA 10063]